MSVAHSLNIVVPMAGIGSRFSAAGYRDPKPLVDVFGKTMIETVVDNLTPTLATRFIFVCQKEHYFDYGLEKVFSMVLGDNWDCIQLDTATDGAARSVLAAKHLFNNDNNLIIANADQIVDIDLTDFVVYSREAEADGVLMTFPATESKWSYLKLDDQGLGVEVAEKKVISRHATTGIYFFRTGKLFISAADQMIEKGIRTNNEFYVAPVYNEIINEGGIVRAWSIESNEMHGIGTPEDLQIYFDSKGGYLSQSMPTQESCRSI